MASTKISALPAASTLTGAETIPLVQGGVTKKVTTDQFLTAANPSYTGTLTGGTGVVNLGSGQFVKDASGNVGVGIASPTQKLDVAGALRVAVASTVAQIKLERTTTAAGHSWIGASSSSLLEVLDSTYATKFRIDQSGNLGLGVTPSAWSTGFKSIQLGAGTALTNANSITQFWLSSNAYYNAGWKYIHSAEASYYEQSLGTHAWFTAPSGTAGNPISFTQVMALNASGVLTLTPTTSPQAALFNYSGGAYTTWQHSGTSLGDIGAANQVIGGGSSADFAISSRSGSLVLGTANGVERARIDASGNLLVGATTASGKLHVTNTNNVSGDTAGYFALGSNTNNASSYFLQCVTSGVGAKAYILGNGNMQNANNSYGAFSDLKLKENITDASPKLDDLMQVRVVNYRFKADPTHKQLGVIAQELEQVFPGLVEETPDRDSDGNDLGTTTKSVKYSVFVPMLIKAVQEQQAQIEALTARLTALESNLKEPPWPTTKKPLSQALPTPAPTPSPSQTHASE